MAQHGSKVNPIHARVSRIRLPGPAPRPTMAACLAGTLGMPNLLLEHCGPVALLTLNRPEKLNALNNDLISALTAALDSMEFDRSVRAIVITGAGRAFSAGADIAEFQPHMKAGPPEAIAHFMRAGASADPSDRAVCEAGHRGHQWPRVRWWLRARGVDAHRPCRGHSRLFQGRNQYRHHSDVWRNATSATACRPQGRH